MALIMRKLLPQLLVLLSILSLIVVATVRRWELFQMDVKNAFLNGELTDEVYMRPPPCYPHPPHQVCKLRQALYGLKQAPRAWFAKFSAIVEGIRFTTSPHDSALFIRRTNKGITLLLLYVDDMIIIGDDTSSILDLKIHLRQHVKMKILASLTIFWALKSLLVPMDIIFLRPSMPLTYLHKQDSQTPRLAPLFSSLTVGSPL